jgi:hypothetical protein
MTKLLTIIGVTIASWILLGLLFQLVRAFTHIAIIVFVILAAVALIRTLIPVDFFKRAR